VQDTGTNKVFDPSGGWLGYVNTSGLFWAQVARLGDRPLALYFAQGNETLFVHPSLLGSTTVNTHAQRSSG
jgi:hypothetical protein